MSGIGAGLAHWMPFHSPCSISITFHGEPLFRKLKHEYVKDGVTLFAMKWTKVTRYFF